MKLYCWRGASRNFGDELNTLLWPRLLPGFFDDDAGELFLGIGSVLDDRHPKSVRKLVAGAGFGGYEALPIMDASWVIHWVRGPRTARLIGLPVQCGLGDPAMLLPVLDWKSTQRQAVGFMPHFESLSRGAWVEAAAGAGVELIDPRGDPAAIIASISHCRVLLTEAMHGAIVADTLRVPWVALRPLMPVHRGKWQDWAESLEMRLRFQALAPSSLPEQLQLSPEAASRHRLLARTWRRRFVARAAAALVRASAAEPQLSAAAALDRCQSRMLEALDRLRLNGVVRAAALHSLRNLPTSLSE